MKRLRACAGLLLVLPAPALAHPHAWVDQQAIVSLDRGAIVIDYRVVPSAKDGAHMFGHLDTDHDGVIGERELHAYAAALLRSTRLIVDGQGIPLRVLSASVPARSAMAGGAGLMTVRATAPLRLAPTHRHVVTLNIGFALFKRGWFIQPFYSTALSRSTPPVLNRSADTGAVTLIIPPANAA